MILQMEAVYENGVFRPLQAVPLAEHQRVIVTIDAEGVGPSAAADASPLPDLEERLAALQALGPMEFEPGERELADRLLAEQDRLSRAVMQGLTGDRP